MVEQHTVSFGYPYRVRYADTDKMQYMYNGHYLTLFEIGRTELLRACGLAYSGLEEQGYLLPLTEARVFYKQPAFYDDLLTIECSYTPEYTVLIRLNYRILRADECIAEGYTVHSFVNNQTRKPVRPPKIFFEALQAYLHSQGKTPSETQE